MIGRALPRVLVVGSLATVGAVGSAGVALAGTPDTWTKETPMPMLEVLGIYAGIPIGLFALITLLVLTPSLIRGSRVQPGVSWSGQPEWFGDRPDAEQSAEADRTEQSTGGPEGTTGTGRGGAGGQW
ncbi:hypothetical protein SAMN05421678_106218 [Actinopolymorpha cephalotaxi]|nr:hypothetical protein [Actinopolymorpha cephalotaxi]SFG51861.1 hypothetical protein SAMN05421678_106218 [Actinopolymorpha cephalotaxi]